MSHKNYAKARDIVTFRTGKLDSNAAVENGKYPFFTCAKTTYKINSFAFDTECVLLAGNNADGIFPLKYFNGKFNAYQRTYVIEAKDKNKFVTKYFYFFLKPYLKALEQHATGATTKFLTLKILHNIDVPLPSTDSQKKIAAILSAYDDLIENNQRRIALLEKMAEEIYREWFVRMRFPGHKQVKFEKGVPEGWTILAISEICAEIRKGIKKKNLRDSDKYIGLEHLPRQSISLREWGTADSIESDKLLFEERDILFGKIRPYLHKVIITHFSGACSSDTIVIRPKKKKYEGFVLFTVFSDTFIELATMASKGTKMPRADWEFLKALELKIPPDDLLDLFQEKFEQFFSCITNLSRSNQILASGRDLLLGSLISGKLSVENLEIHFPPSMREAGHD